MKIYVDADASPVVKETISVAKEFQLTVFLIKSYAHFSTEPVDSLVDVLYVDAEREATDMAITERAKKGDVVITQDYGLASLCLTKGCLVLHHKGFIYSDKNIERLLALRHEHAKLRRAGKRTKGPRAFTKEDREKFKQVLSTVIHQALPDE